MPKLRQIDFACPRCKYPFGSGGNLVMMVSCFFSYVVLDDVSDEMLAARDLLRRFYWCLFPLAPRVDYFYFFGFEGRVPALLRRRLQRCCADEQQCQRPHRGECATAGVGEQQVLPRTWCTTAARAPGISSASRAIPF